MENSNLQSAIDACWREWEDLDPATLEDLERLREVAALHGYENDWEILHYHRRVNGREFVRLEDLRRGDVKDLRKVWS